MTERRPASPINIGMANIHRNFLEHVKGDNRSYSVVDYPAYNNIGDSAIWTGQRRALLDVFKKAPRYVASQQDYKKDIEAFCGDGVIFINGGGNFGNLWPQRQEFRLQIIRDHPHRKIVQLPQSICFSGSEYIDETKYLIGSHKNFHLCVRDQPSFDFASREFDCPVYIAPDAAHCISTYKAAPSRQEIFSLIRSDKESLTPDLYDLLSPYGPTADWEGISRYFYETEGAIDKFFRRKLQHKFPSSNIIMSYRLKMYDRMAQNAVDRGTKLLSQGKLIISDRLHAHIICVLMGKRHISIDNANGKVGEYIRKWGDFGITELVSSRASLLERIEASRTTAHN
ncbi:Putative pyruvyl transferase EpsO [Jannaschia seosinensis]|uniref:Putative pyruvyl transferase EpsO n=1 Tax=Jannaschia seosinensis TaxID=313367 RepID=A0A0M7B564_9RHOB|nr:polysaccharide pyruvyl transferase family protein [Jannaschia seosinensis]CUH20572.1 Putative pyruvyl transferase EpsO [Jannaschia seosinensis]